MRRMRETNPDGGDRGPYCSLGVRASRGGGVALSCSEMSGGAEAPSRRISELSAPESAGARVSRAQSHSPMFFSRTGTRMDPLLAERATQMRRDTSAARSLSKYIIIGSFPLTKDLRPQDYGALKANQPACTARGPGRRNRQIRVGQRRLGFKEKADDDRGPTPRCRTTEMGASGAESSRPALLSLVAVKTRTKDKYRVVYTDHQRLELEKEFHYSRYITIRRKAELAATLGLSERQVKIWFQNRRAKERKINKKKLQQQQPQPPPAPQPPQPQPGPLRRGPEPLSPVSSLQGSVKIWFQNRRAKERKINKKKLQQQQPQPPPAPQPPQPQPGPLRSVPEPLSPVSSLQGSVPGSVAGVLGPTGGVLNPTVTQ
ncbi:homeobox protein CDX-2-like protein [Camelus ferus]|nr:homeobox protein CDX-2-like protein [Camelus ferus]